MSKNRIFLNIAFFIFITGFICCAKKTLPGINDMRCEYQSSPISIDTRNPRFTWNYSDEMNGSGFMQDSYELRISTNREILENDEPGDVWNSGLVRSVNSHAVLEGEDILKPHTRYYWQVKSYDTKNGKIESNIASFMTAKLDPEDWSAKWISDKHNKEYGPAPMFRKVFDIDDRLVSRAILYSTAAAYGKYTINGQPVSEALLSPGYTHYDKRNLYSVDDVTGIVKNGRNVIAVVCGNGFYNADAPVATWDFEKARWRDRAKMLCELRITYSDGTEQIIASDESWKTSTGPYVYNNIYSGDTYDARLEIDGWDTRGFDDSSWEYAIAAEAPSNHLVAQNMPAIEVEKELKPVDLKSWEDTLYVYNFGVNMSGFCRLEIEGERGTKVTIKYGELQREDGNIEMRNIDIYYKPVPGLAFQTDVYYLSGNGTETFTPDFTYHGFQYVEVRSDRPVKLTEESLTALFFHTALEPVGSFKCSNEMLNKLWAATNQTYLSNLHGILTDCPQREKNGWTADAHISMDIGLLNFDGITFYEKWLNDMIDNQRPEGNISGIIPSAGWGYDDWIGPVWDAAMFIVPYSLYCYYGDTRVLEKMYPACEKYLQYLKNREEEEGLVTYGIGDWVYYDTQTPTEYTTPCYYYLDNVLMARFSEIIGKDGSVYSAKAAQLKETINIKYFNADQATYANGSQAAQAVALALGIVPERYEQKVADKLNDIIVANNYFLDFGLLGSKFVPRMLAKYGYANTAFKMAFREEAPSWGNWMKLGYTTLPETWVLSPVFRDASLNHVFLGDISAWMYNALAGINYDESNPGFRNIIINPHFVDELDWVEAEYRSVNGLVKSEWKRAGDKIKLTVTIPENTTATVIYGNNEKKVSSGKHTFTY